MSKEKVNVNNNFFFLDKLQFYTFAVSPIQNHN